MIKFDALKMLVVDEADQMFQIGFRTEVEEIIAQTPKSRQTLCYSATLSHAVDTFSNATLNEPVLVKAPKKQVTLEAIEQFVYNLPDVGIHVIKQSPLRRVK